MSAACRSVLTGVDMRIDWDNLDRENARREWWLIVLGILVLAATGLFLARLIGIS